MSAAAISAGAVRNKGPLTEPRGGGRIGYHDLTADGLDIAADTPFSCPDSLESSYYFRGLRGSGTSPFVAKSLSHSTKRSRGHFRSK